MKIQSITIKNFKVFRDAQIKDISGFAVLLGANGTGKSSFFDVFGFLKDALIHNVYKALALRGGYQEVVSRECKGPIVFELKFRETGGRLVTYHLSIGQKDGRPIVEREFLKYRRGQRGQPWMFLDFREGEGQAVTNEAEYGKPDAEMKREPQQLESPDILAIKGLGQFQKFKVVSSFRRLIENWHVSDFRIEDARPSQDEGHAEHLSSRGDNLALVTRFLHERHPEILQDICDKMRLRVPGVALVGAEPTVDGRVVLRFQDGSFRDPFIARYVSDGTIKMFAYLVLLNDPKSHPLLCVEEPENQLYPHLLVELAEEFRAYSQSGGQVFVTTHSPDFLNGINLEEIFICEKRDGFSMIRRAADNDQARALVEAGDLPGALWCQGLLTDG